MCKCGALVHVSPSAMYLCVCVRVGGATSTHFGHVVVVVRSI